MMTKKKPTKLKNPSKKYYNVIRKFLTKEYSSKKILQILLGTVKSKHSSFKVAVKKRYDLSVKYCAGLLFHQYYGVKLFKRKTITVGYITLLVVFYGLLLIIPKSLLDASAYINFTEQSLTILIVLLTILLSAGLVLLGDDTRSWSLARVVIIRNIVKLKGLMIACLTVILISVAPDYSYFGFGLKTLLSPLLLISLIYILGIYLRIYLWLSDLAADPSFFEPQDPAKPGDKLSERGYISGSYRFARIINLIHEIDARDAWQAVLEKKIPYGYEELLHEEFFEGAETILNSKKKDKYSDLSVRLEIYDKYYPRRNLESWRFYLDYTKRFLLIYSSLSKLMKQNREASVTQNLWRGKHALENINKQLVTASMDNERIWSLLDAMDAYINDRDLVLLHDRNRSESSIVLDHFLNELFESLFEDKIETYDFDSYFNDHSHWLITRSNLYDNLYNISFVVEKSFREWLFKKLANAQDQENLLNIDQIIELLFTDADPITIGALYWLLYNAQHTTESIEIVESQYKNPRHFGLIGRTLVNDWDNNEARRNENFAANNRIEVDNAIKLFVAKYGGYFRGFWNIDELISTAERVLSRDSPSSSDLAEDEILRLESFIERLRKIREVLHETNG